MVTIRKTGCEVNRLRFLKSACYFFLLLHSGILRSDESLAHMERNYGNVYVFCFVFVCDSIDLNVFLAF